MTRKILFIIGFALLHSAMTLFAGMSALGAAMQGFEKGPATSPSTVKLYGNVADVLSFPLGRLDPRIAPGSWGWLLLMGNGMLWACVLVAAWSGARWLRSRPS
jgi:hypothetical protein